MKLRHYFVDDENRKVIVLEEKIASSDLDFSPGARFRYEGGEYFVIVVLDYKTVMVRNMKDGRVQHLDIPLISRSAVQMPSSDDQRDLTVIPDKDWNTAYKRFEIIRPVIEAVGSFGNLKRYEAISVRAAETDVSFSTIKRWLSRYIKYRQITALMPKRRMDSGKYRLSEKAESILAAVVRARYLNNQKLAPAHVAREVHDACLREHVTPPHPNTVRNRIAGIPPSVLMKTRKGAYEAKNRYDFVGGSNELIKWPLAVVQIDHTLIDIILVDDVLRKPIGRPWLTVAIDTFSRMVAGFYLSFDNPSVASVGICISTAIIPKDKIIINKELEAEWPVWGKMDTIHVDNAKEFRSSALKKACEEYGINLDWRPVKRPNYGGHIERLLGTFAGEIHTLPGTTFSDISARKGYDSEKKAALTLKEFEYWLLMYILKVYHVKTHSGIGMSPQAKYREGIFGTEAHIGRGLPPRAMDEKKSCWILCHTLKEAYSATVFPLTALITFMTVCAGG